MKKKEKAKERAPPDQVKITRLVREIISGRPINQVPDKLLPRVHIELACAKTRAMKDGLINRIQMIQKVMIDVEQYEKERAKLKSAKSRPRSSFLSREDNSKITNDDSDDIDAIFEIYQPPPVAVLDSILDDLADGIPFEIAETPNIPYLIDRSKERIDEYLQSGEYFTAQRYENVHVQLVSLMEDRKKEKKIETKLNYLTNLLSENQAKLKEIKDEKKRKLDEHFKKVNDSLSKSREEYERANSEYDEITNGPLPISARKFSSEYLNMREKERFLIQSRRYEEAASIKAEADKMEAKELSMLCDDFIEKREKKKKIIVEKQNKSLNCIIENGERTKLKIINEYDQKIQELQRTVENIQNRIKLVDSNYLNEIEEDQQIVNQSSSAFSNVNQFKLNPIQENSSTTNAKKNKSKYTLPAVPRETATSKLRSSPFVTQAAPQIKSPEKQYLSFKNKNQNQNKFAVKEKKESQKIKLKSNDSSPEKEIKVSSSLVSSYSFISDDDEKQKKSTKSKNSSAMSIDDNSKSNISIDDNNKSNISIDDNNKSNISIDDNNKSNISIDDNNKSNISIDDNNKSNISIDDDSRNSISVDDNNKSNISIDDKNDNSVKSIDDNSKSNISIDDNSKSNISIDDNSKSNISIDDNSKSNISIDDNSKSNISIDDNNNSNISIGDNNKSNISIDEKNKNSSKSNESINISFGNNSFDENKSNLSNENINDGDDDFVVVDDFIVDDEVGGDSNDTNSKGDACINDDDIALDDQFFVDQNRSKSKEISKDLIKKKKKNDVMQPNTQVIRNKNTFNHDMHRPPSVQKKMAAPSKKSRSQVRDKPPTPHLYSPNLNSKKRNEKTENPIRVAKSSSKK